jgi:hypothetical protein
MYRYLERSEITTHRAARSIENIKFPALTNGLCFMGLAGPRRSFDYHAGRPYWVDDLLEEDYSV